jgi:hypothetical protein
MTTTPFCARVPYRAAAAPPFNTEMSAMSSGLSFERASPPSVPPQRLAFPSWTLRMGTPSTTYSGSFPARLAFPRIVMRDDPPGPVGGDSMLTPDTRP